MTEQNIKENAEKSRLLTWAASAAVKAGNLEEAEKIYRKALVLDKSSFHAAFCLSTLLTQRGEYEEGIGHASHCTLLHPMEEEPWEQLVNVYNYTFENSSPEQSQKLYKLLSNFQSDGFVDKRHKMHAIKPGDILIRVLEEEYADLLLEEGELFFRTTKYFRELETSDPRQDEFENNPSVHDVIPTVTKIMPNGWVKQETNIPGIYTTSPPGSKGPVYFDWKFEIGGMESLCCFSIVSRENIAEFLKKYDDEKLGGKAIVIKNAPKFIKRVEAAFASLEKASVKTGYVTYIHEGAIKRCFQPPNSSRPLNPFIKRRKYSSEFEYRLVTRSLKTSEGGEGAKMRIGSIEDIADKMDTKQLKDWLTDYC